MSEEGSPGTSTPAVGGFTSEDNVSQSTLSRNMPSGDSISPSSTMPRPSSSSSRSADGSSRLRVASIVPSAQPASNSPLPNIASSSDSSSNESGTDDSAGEEGNGTVPQFDRQARRTHRSVRLNPLQTSENRQRQARVIPNPGYASVRLRQSKHHNFT